MTPHVEFPRAVRGFPKSDRLLRRSEFVLAQSRGQRTHTPHFTVIVRARGDERGPRIGITTSKRTAASAVRRNRLRRLVREVFRNERERFPRGCDCVVIAKENAPDLAFSVVRDEILRAMSRSATRTDRPTVPRS